MDDPLNENYRGSIEDLVEDSVIPDPVSEKGILSATYRFHMLACWTGIMLKGVESPL